MSSSVTQSVSSASQWLQKKLVDVHRVLLLLRTSLLASVLTLEVPLPAVLAAFSLRSFSYTYVTIMIKNQIDLPGIRTRSCPSSTSQNIGSTRAHFMLGYTIS